MTKSQSSTRDILKSSLAAQQRRLSQKRRGQSQLWFPEYHGRESEFQSEVLGLKLWEFQRYATEALFKHHYLSIRTCHGPGKTKWSASIVLTFLLTRKDSVVITTAPTGHQIRNLLWSEVGDIHAKAKLPLPHTPDQVQYRLGPRWYGLGISTDKPARFQGFHGSSEVPDDPDADIDVESGQLEGEELTELAEEVKDLSKGAEGGLLFVFDEAAGVNQAIFNAAKGAFTSAETYVVLLGNPDIDIADDHEFVNSHRDDSRYHRIKVAAEDSPDDPLTADKEWSHVPNWLIAPSWLEDRRRDYGTGTAIYQSKIRAQFASGDATNRIMPYELLVIAEQNEPNVKLGCHMGVDISAGGGDKSVVALWVDGSKRCEYDWRPRFKDKAKLMTAAHKIVGLRDHWNEQLKAEGYGLDGTDPIPWNNVHIDTIGMGGGVCDRIAQLGYRVDRVDFGTPPKGDWKRLVGDVRFANRRAELHWVMRRAAEEGMLHLDRKWKDSWKEAQWASFDTDIRSNGSVILVTPKKAIRRAHKASPDHWDADLLAWSRTGRARVNFSRR